MTVSCGDDDGGVIVDIMTGVSPRVSDRIHRTTPLSLPLSFDALPVVFDDQRSLPTEALSALYHVFADAASDGALRMVESGAGTGRIAIPALAAGHHVTAIDVSRPMLDAFSTRLESLPDLASRATLLVGDATALPLDDDSFDLGILAQVLYLIPDWARAIDEVFRVVRPGGEAVLAQERSAMSPALRERDAAWRAAVESVGYRHMPQRPDDNEAVAALELQSGQVAEQVVASWPFGQTAAEADTGVQRLRPLYETLDEMQWDDMQWDEALKRFRQWQQAHPIDPETWLGGTVDLVLVRGTVPEGQR
jgi:SAM-dependent methyltransferase